MDHDHGALEAGGDGDSRAANVSKRSSDVFALQELGVELLLREGAVGRRGHANLRDRWKDQGTSVEVAQVWLSDPVLWCSMQHILTYSTYV